MRSASGTPIDTAVAPVSTRKRTAWPLIAPLEKKCPPDSAFITMREPRAGAPPLPPTLAGASPTRKVCRLPAISTTAWSPEVDTTFTPLCVSPAATVLGAPPSTISSALPPSIPCKATDCAKAQTDTHKAKPAMMHFFMGSVAEVVEGERYVVDFLADQRHGGLQVITLAAGDAHGIALDRRLHFQLAVLD